MTKIKILSSILLVLLVSCKPDSVKTLKTGTYRAVLQVKDAKELPFTFTVNPQETITIYNAEERIAVDAPIVKGDSVYIKLPFFDAKITAFINDNGSLNGYYTKENRNNKVMFSAMHDVYFRYPTDVKKVSVAGEWEVTFSHNSPNSYKAKGVFKAGDNNTISGTFLTETGDYRFLEGAINRNNISLSCFDGTHAFLFDGTVVGDSITSGMFYSGNTYKAPWVAVRNSNFELANPNTLTTLKDGQDTLSFSFPNLEGEMVSLTDAQFKNKVTVIQLMGSWCPNCIDESTYLGMLHNSGKFSDLQIIGLAFENSKTMDKAVNRLQKLKDRLAIKYPILVAQIGTVSKKKAAEKLPMLSEVKSYPTTIFIDKKGKVRKIHTGFNGPATGDKYTVFTEEFETFVAVLLAE